ncbi:Cof-type HAD-IIB family hydrolase [Bacillus massiliglaciei]|uniref:Cof-type HAD-IIB family hydrolase n=1 Tax=Bacillus massiliglaciei TaxID=1816693 RepID=UPI000DA603DB|nr:Cof-type HAD-IIB family hydrolase [Bacillus massiliglaciei]
MIRTIAIDMDGTLLNEVQQVSKANGAAIREAQNCGIEVVIATGRSKEEARYSLKQAGLEMPVICMNGGALLNTEDEIIVSNPLDRTIVQEAVSLLESRDAYFEIYTNQGVFTRKFEVSVAVLTDIFVSANPDLNPVKVQEFAEERLTLGQMKKVHRYEDLLEDETIEYYKLLIFSNDYEMLGETASGLKSFKGVAVTSSGRENIEMTSEHAQKGIVLEQYVKSKGKSMAETMAIGDNFNDISMFERVGRSVAMGNAPLEIQKLCDEVTAKNTENGVALAIRKVLD